MSDTFSSPASPATASPQMPHKGAIDLVKHRSWYLGSSVLLVLPGLVFLVLNILQQPNHAPLKLGIDFLGGTLLEVKFDHPLKQADVAIIRDTFEAQGYTGTQVQLKQVAGSKTIQEASIRLRSLPETKPTATAPTPDKAPAPSNQDSGAGMLQYHETDALAKAQTTLTQKVGAYKVLQKVAIGPTLAQEILNKGILALVLAYALIVGYLTFRFQWDYALCAILALLHDTLFVLGVFAGLGYLFGVEVDALFITGILTVIGFSVHDTIVVFDRLRENLQRYFTLKLPFSEIANISINQTLARSINTSLTAILTLLALMIFGGETTRQFVFVMFLGILVGTYSSIFFAALLLTWMREPKHAVKAA
jgi:preprotein translocase subunit SecF